MLARLRRLGRLKRAGGRCWVPPWPSGRSCALLRIGGPGREEGARKLSLYSTAGLRVPVEEIAGQYQREYGIRLRCNTAVRTRC